MGKSARIFKSFAEQEKYHKQLMLLSTVTERFRKLYQMQPITKLFPPANDHSRKIQVLQWIS